MRSDGIVLGAPRGIEHDEQRAPPAEVAMIGCGVVGTNAAKAAAGMGAHVTILDTNHGRLKCLGEAELLEGRK